MVILEILFMPKIKKKSGSAAYIKYEDNLQFPWSIFIFLYT